MHKEIHRFNMSGVIRDDSDFIRLREQHESQIITQMREDGYIPLLDLGPLFSTAIIDKGYTFDLTVYGIYVGKRRACLIEGMDGVGRMLPRSTVKTKSKQH